MNQVPPFPLTPLVAGNKLLAADEGPEGRGSDLSSRTRAGAGQDGSCDAGLCSELLGWGFGGDTLWGINYSSCARRGGPAEPLLTASGPPESTPSTFHRTPGWWLGEGCERSNGAKASLILGAHSWVYIGAHTSPGVNTHTHHTHRGMSACPCTNIYTHAQHA